MKKKVLALLLSGAMVVSLAGCGGSTEGTPAAAEETTETEAAEETEGEGEAEVAEASGEGGLLTGTLKLGMIGPLTGAAALYGTAVNNAA